MKRGKSRSGAHSFMAAFSLRPSQYHHGADSYLLVHTKEGATCDSAKCHLAHPGGS